MLPSRSSFIGIGPYVLAFLACGQGLRFGHPGLLSALCYSVPNCGHHTPGYGWDGNMADRIGDFRTGCSQRSVDVRNEHKGNMVKHVILVFIRCCGDRLATIGQLPPG